LGEEKYASGAPFACRRGARHSGTRDMTQRLPNLQINSARLWGDIHETAKFGGTRKGGVRRLTLSDEDRRVRDWFRAACEAAGCEVHVDGLGSMFAIRPGRDKSAPISTPSRPAENSTACSACWRASR
jgi:hypothetical protein